MKIILALIVILITQAIGETDDVKDVEEVEVKSAKTEDDVKSVDELNREAESYTVPVEVVKDAVNDSESVRKDDTDEHNEDSRVERSTASDTEDYSRLKSLKNDELLSESGHNTNRRSNDETSKTAKTEETLVKSDDAEVREAKPEAKTEKDDVLKKGSEEEQDNLQVKSADDADANAKLAADDKSKLDDDVGGFERVAEVEDMNSFVTEGVDVLKANLNNRRMLNPIETLLETKARLGEIVGMADKESVKFDDDDTSKSTGNLRSFDSFGPLASQTLLPPLVSLPNKQNFFLAPALPLQPQLLGLSTQAPLRSYSNHLQNRAPLQNFLHPEQKPFNGLNPFQNSRTFPQLPFTTTRPLVTLSPLANLPSFDKLFKKPAELKSQENLHYYSNVGFNLPQQVAYGLPNYLQYSPNLK